MYANGSFHLMLHKAKRVECHQGYEKKYLAEMVLKSSGESVNRKLRSKKARFGVTANSTAQRVSKV